MLYREFQAQRITMISFYAQDIDRGRCYFYTPRKFWFLFAVLGFLFMRTDCTNGYLILENETNSTEPNIQLFRFDDTFGETEGYGTYGTETALLTLHLHFKHSKEKSLNVEISLITPEMYSVCGVNRIYKEFTLNRERKLTVEFEHLFRGVYKLEIQPTLDYSSEPRVDLQLPYLNTSREYFDVTNWNLFLDWQQRDNQSMEIYLQDWNNTLHIFNFSQYSLTLKNENSSVKDGIFRQISIALEDFTYDGHWTYRKVMEPLDIGCYVITVEAIDARCRNWPEPESDCFPCRRRVNKACLLEMKRIPVRYPNDQNQRLVVTAIVTTVFILAFLILSYLAKNYAILYCRKLKSWSRGELVGKDGANQHTRTIVLSTPIPVLLIYSSRNQPIGKKVEELRKYLEDTKLFQVYDSEDEREWDKRAMYGINWWHLKLADPAMRIVIVESPEMIQCLQNRFSSSTNESNEHETTFVLKLLQPLTITKEINARIFVVSFGSNEEILTTLGALPLQPFIRYQLPNHLAFLQRDLIQAVPCTGKEDENTLHQV